MNNYRPQTVVVQGLGFVGSAMAVAVASAFDYGGKPYFNVIGVDLPTESGKEKVKKIKEAHSSLWP
jgi:UDP-N-acetyl-D-mannosaminuronate dehydrogenase